MGSFGQHYAGILSGLSESTAPFGQTPAGIHLGLSESCAYSDSNCWNSLSIGPFNQKQNSIQKQFGGENFEPYLSVILYKLLNI